MRPNRTLEQIRRAMVDPAIDIDGFVKDTAWEDDPRVEALRKAEEAVGDMLWEMHLAAEDADGVLCPDCRQDAHEEATRP